VPNQYPHDENDEDQRAKSRSVSEQIGAIFLATGYPVQTTLRMLFLFVVGCGIIVVGLAQHLNVGDRSPTDSTNSEHQQRP
jgi:hypothetical protein